jgi:hypothetical protein
LRWTLTLLAFAVLIVVVAIVVRSGGSSEARTSTSAELEANHEGEVVIAADQAPHTAPLTSGAPALASLQRAIAADARERIRRSQLTGPLQSVHCEQSDKAKRALSPFSCTVRSAGISYPFLAVLDARTHTLTWCKRDPPPTSDAPLNVPVSSRCRV